MSLLSRLGLKSTILSFLELIIVFPAVTYLYGLAAVFIYARTSRQLSEILKHYKWTELFLFYPFGWFGWPPIWLIAACAPGYLALITIYWAPGTEEQNECEVRALTGVALLALAASVGFGIYLWPK
jgi:hypothetical protein